MKYVDISRGFLIVYKVKTTHTDQYLKVNRNHIKSSIYSW